MIAPTINIIITIIVIKPCTFLRLVISSIVPTINQNKNTAYDYILGGVLYSYCTTGGVGGVGGVTSAATAGSAAGAGVGAESAATGAAVAVPPILLNES